MNVQRKIASNGKLVSGGRLQIPADIRKELGLSDGDAVQMRVVDGVLQIRSMREVIAEIQALFRPYVPEGVSIVDEFIAERRQAAENE